MKKLFSALLLLLCVALGAAEPVPFATTPAPYTIDSIDVWYKPTVMFRAGGEWRHGREPTLRRMPDGSLISTVYSGGRREPAPDNVVLVVRSHDDGTTWEAPELLFASPTRSLWATEVFTGGPRTMMAVHTWIYPTIFREMRTFWSYSDDSGKSWSQPVSLPGVPPNCAIREGIVLSDGTWIFPVYWVEQLPREPNTLKEDGDIDYLERYVSAVIRSTDKGKTFTLHGYLHRDGSMRHIPYNGDSLWEGAVTELSPGHLLMYIRGEGPGVLWQSESHDGGLSWGPAVLTDIPNSGTKISFMKVGGKTLLFHNPTTTGRREMALWVSGDGCKTWEKKLPIARIHDDRVIQPVICYPHGFADDERQEIYLSIDAVLAHYMIRIPYADFLP